MDSAWGSIGMHRCPPIFWWTPSSGTLCREARWGRRTLTPIGRLELLDIPGRWEHADAFGRARLRVPESTL